MTKWDKVKYILTTFGLMGALMVAGVIILTIAMFDPAIVPQGYIVGGILFILGYIPYIIQNVYKRIHDCKHKDSKEEK